MRTWSPTFNSGSDFVCCDQYSCAAMFLFLKAFSLSSVDSIHVLCGRYLPGRIGMRSLVGLPKMHIAGDCFVAGSGAFRYWRIACWKLSMSRLPLEPVFPMIRRLIVFTAISARQLLCGYATGLRRWWTPQSCRNFWVVWATNSGPPSEASSSGIP